MQVQFISSVAIITPDPQASRKLYVDALGLPLEPAKAPGDYVYSEKIGGSKHFGVWPLTDAAEACFGATDWPADRPLPQMSVEFEVGSADEVTAAAGELVDRGFTLIHNARTEPWGQTVARIITLEGVIVGLSYAPWMHGGAE